MDLKSFEELLWRDMYRVYDIYKKDNKEVTLDMIKKSYAEDGINATDEQLRTAYEFVVDLWDDNHK